jgi:DNA recombination protein RmuC
MDISTTTGVLIFAGGVLAGASLALLFSSMKKRSSVELITRLKMAEDAAVISARKIEEQARAIMTLEKEKALAEKEAGDASRNMEEQKRLLSEAEGKMANIFKALAGDTLKSNNQAFLDLAKENLQSLVNEARGDMGRKEDAIKNLIKPLEETLKRYETQVKEMESARAGAFGGLEQQLRSLVETQDTLKKETGNLVTALRRPEVRGRWGEITLKRAAELAGMTEYCDYTQQVSVETAEGRMRPDMVVHLPAGREIVVDSKVSLEAYLESVSAETDDRKKTLMAKHAQQVRKHMKDLASKAYWDQFGKAPEFVVMFIPGEPFLSAAVECDPALIEDGMGNKVIIATPTTFVALLRAIAYGWRQEKFSENIQEISKIGKELYDRFHPFLDHVSGTGNALAAAVKAFNKMLGSLDERILVSVRKFRELGVSGEKELAETKKIDITPTNSEE